MNGYEAYQTYLSVKLHFDSDYDFFKYHGKSRSSEQSFNLRKDKYSYHKLSRMYNDQEFVSFLAVMFCHDDRVFVRDLFGPTPETRFKEDSQWKKEWKKNLLADLQTMGTFSEAIKRKDEFSYPPLLTLAFQGEVNYNTMALLEEHAKILTAWNKFLQGDFIWDSYYKRMCNYVPFVSHGFNAIDSVASKLFLIDTLKQQ